MESLEADQDDSTKNKYMSDPMAITWAVKYQDTLEKYWGKIPRPIGTALASISVFVLGSTIRGDWLHMMVHFLRAFNQNTTEANISVQNYDIHREPYYLMGIDLEPYHLSNFPWYYVAASTISYMFFFGIGGFLHWYYYIRRRDRAIEWKCQPDAWLSPELEKHEIMLGTFSLSLGSFVSSMLACYISNGGWSTIYYDISEQGWVYYIISWPFLFIWQDYLTYWHHRLYHYPLLYKNFHKLHHKYKQPTAFSVTAIHPIEFLHMQAVLISPMFLFPVHYSVFCTCLIYLYYHGIIDHSGINFKAHWWQPWQPDCIFHDNHHQYFHVNFGFNCELWDKIHGTYRQKNKVYREDIYYGKGKHIEQCSKTELEKDLEEREAENTLAYRDNMREKQIETIKQKLKTN